MKKNQKSCVNKNIISTFEVYQKDTLSYGLHNNLLTYLCEYVGENSMIDDELQIYTYDYNNNLLSVLLQKEKDNIWVNSSLLLRDYDENGNCILAERLQWSGESWQPAFIPSPDTYYPLLYYNHMQSVCWIVGDINKMTASYIKVANPNSIEDVASSTIAIYPNPTFGQLSISNDAQTIQSVSIYNLSGALLFITQETENIDISHLTTGIYFVQITTNNGVVTRQIVKR